MMQKFKILLIISPLFSFIFTASDPTVATYLDQANERLIMLLQNATDEQPVKFIVSGEQTDDKHLINRANYITRACVESKLSIADYTNAFGIPVVNIIGNINILALSNKNITSLYGLQNISLTDLYIIDLSNNCIVGNILDPLLPNNPFQGLQEVFSLSLNNNNIESLPASFFDQIKNMRYLNIADNKLTALNALLHELVWLKITNNTIPASMIDFSIIPSLETLYFDYNSLTDLPDHFFQNNNQLRYLFLNNNELNSIPPTLFNDIPQIKYIDLSYNVLSSFEPETILDGIEVILTANQLTTSQQEFIQSSFPEVNFAF